MKILVTGGRDYQGKQRLFMVLDELRRSRGITKVVHGAARGVDTLARKWARLRGIPEQGYPAQWRKYDRGPGKNPAGAIRNREMYETERPDLVVAFPGGNGTFNMCEIARAGGTEVLLIDGGPVRQSTAPSGRKVPTYAARAK